MTSRYPAPPPFDPTGGNSSNSSNNNTNNNSDSKPDEKPSSGGGTSSSYPAPPPFEPSKPSGNNNPGNGTTENDGPATIGGDNIASFRLEFNKIDKNGSGFVEPLEIHKLFMGYIPDAMIKQVVKFMDTNKDGKIDFDEYTVIRKKLAALKSGKS